MKFGDVINVIRPSTLGNVQVIFKEYPSPADKRLVSKLTLQLEQSNKEDETVLKLKQVYHHYFGKEFALKDNQSTGIATSLSGNVGGGNKVRFDPYSKSKKEKPMDDPVQEQAPSVQGIIDMLGGMVISNKPRLLPFTPAMQIDISDQMLVTHGKFICNTSEGARLYELNMDGKIVVVKVYNTTAGSLDQKDQFNNERDILASCDFGGMVVERIGHDDREFHNKKYIYKYYKNFGQALYDQHNHLNEFEKLNHSIEIAAEMFYFHSQNIAIRNLHTSNIAMVNGNLAFTNFSVAKIYNPDDDKMTYVGNPGSISVQVLDTDETVDIKKNDIFAFAGVVYEIYERRPFFSEYHENNELYLLNELIKSDYRPEFTDQTPKPIRKLIKRLWARKEEDRPPSFQLIVEELIDLQKEHFQN